MNNDHSNQEQPGEAAPGPAEPGPAEPGPAEPGPAEPGQAAPPSRRGSVRRVLTSRGAGWVVAAVLAGAVVALSAVLATQPEAVAVQVPFRAAGPVFAGPGGPAFVAPRQFRISVVRPYANGSGAVWVSLGPGVVQKIGSGRVEIIAPGGGQVVGPRWQFAGGPAPFGMTGSPFGSVVAGVVGSVSKSSFTIVNPAGGSQPVTVTEQASTLYRKAGSPAPASAVTAGQTVAVLGTQNGTNLTAIVVAVLG